MKNFLLVALLFSLSSCRIGDFTLLATKNIDNSKMTEYVLLKSNVIGYGWDIKSAADDCVEQVEGGVYLQNAVIIEGILMYRVKADVWGTKQ